MKPIPRKVELAAHNPAWAAIAEQETARLRHALGAVCLDVQHVGSTSIAGIVAKPIIDFLVVAPSLEDFDAKQEAMCALGYTWRGNLVDPEGRYCTFNDPVGRRLFHVHACARNHRDCEYMPAFRDYLRAHPAEAQAYESEKQRAAAIYPDNTIHYCEEKAAWVVACIERAVAWQRASTCSTREA